METKICKMCGKELPTSEFYKSKINKDGFENCCKECKKQYSKQYRAKHKEEISEKRKEYQHQYYTEHKEGKSEYNKRYRVEHKDDISESKKQYYQENREEMLEYWKQYYSTIKGYCYNIRKNNIREDRIYGRIGEEVPDNYPTIEYYIDAVQQPCIYCKKHKPFNEMGLDRIDNDKPHSLDNVVPCCTECNVKRGRWHSHDEFKDIVRC